ncbi:hypothetical protein DDE82_006820 [Stemphylium lycopersici]|uniref:Uncharacterized protein n=1 Tax=Stemphylium lycopersici TaxID=183478 RepID=A0A364N5W9_STELY|nr:hypothetical protein TW65_97096 [Stemphylium lycopersici]RAR01030.1 hypothetical protein DDE82_006820 [Stemphylium lycopersici]RAR12197.1 hypothetical protein DDE83_004202 [Stemphylium lycopersici]
MSSSDSPDTHMDARSNSALASTRRNLRYLYDPKSAPNAVSSRRTRALLRVLRSSVIFAFWKIVRWAKYVAIGSLVATVGAGAFGTFVSGAGFVLAPTGIAGTIFAATVWGVGRFAIGRVKKRWGDRSGYEDEEEEEEEEGWRGRRRGGAGTEYGFEAMPW